MDNMQALLILFFVTGFINIIKSEEDCDKLGTTVYEDIGCSPVYRNGTGCPVKYECPDFTSSSDSCVFRGRRYNVGEGIENNLIYESCYVGCTCQNLKSKPQFQCAVLDCPEWLGRFEIGCHGKYELDKCCSIGTICPRKVKVEECEFDGTKYREGDKFYPKNTCLKCVCKKDFHGKLEKPFCKKNPCALQISNSDTLEQFCAPVYFLEAEEKALCCPDAWICSSPHTTIEIVKPNPAPDSDLTCKFGSKSLKLGEGFFGKSKYYDDSEIPVFCECVLPPLLTCKGKLKPRNI